MDHIPSLKQYHPSIDCPCGEILEDVNKDTKREKKEKERERGWDWRGERRRRGWTGHFRRGKI